MFGKMLEKVRKVIEEELSKELERPFNDPEAEHYTKTFYPTDTAGKMIEDFLLWNGYEEGKDFPVQGVSPKYPDILIELITGMRGYGMNVISTTDRWGSWKKLKRDLLKEYPEMIFAGCTITVTKKSS